ncbi:hypothetical protein A5885_002236 [Enterococcus sp. 8E11_MSG4843]|nr:hypothetical protein A5885_002236 [Enterococcus sp. 8E11_MSG4843]
MNDKQLKIVQSWGKIKSRAFAQTWTDDDEQTYRQLFGTSLRPLEGESKCTKKYVC